MQPDLNNKARQKDVKARFYSDCETNARFGIDQFALARCFYTITIKNITKPVT
jgi:hypothetical protein